jgi:ribosomal protein S18 acetylase RimI-like enzyme
MRRVYAKASIFMVVAVEVQGKSKRLVGFAYLRGDELPGDLSMSICVHDAYQRQGIASRLMEQLVRRAKSDGARRIVLSVHKDNVKAIPLYEKYGFLVDSHRMALELDGEQGREAGRDQA